MGAGHVVAQGSSRHADRLRRPDKAPLPAVYVRVASVPRNPEFKASLAKARTLVPLLGPPLAVLIASGDFARAESMAILNPWIQDCDNMYSDEPDRIKCGLYPGQTYATTCHIPDHYFPVPPDGWIDEIPTAWRSSSCRHRAGSRVSARGSVQRRSGPARAGVRIRATVAAASSSENQTKAGAADWTQPDASGDFHFDGLEPGTRLTLVSVAPAFRSEQRMVVLGDHVGAAGAQVTKSGEWKLTQVLREKREELASLGGHIVGPDHRPIPGAEVVVEIERSPNGARYFRATADAAGRVQTPAISAGAQVSPGRPLGAEVGRRLAVDLPPDERESIFRRGGRSGPASPRPAD